MKKREIFKMFKKENPDVTMKYDEWVVAMDLIKKGLQNVYKEKQNGKG